MGSLHDHVINFKVSSILYTISNAHLSDQVDLDIVGTKNSLLNTSTAVEAVEAPWFNDDWGRTVIQQRITREFIKNENEALLKYPQNFQGGYAIVNRDERNSWNTERGYSIHPGLSPIHNVSPNLRCQKSLIEPFERRLLVARGC